MRSLESPARRTRALAPVLVLVALVGAAAAFISRPAAAVQTHGAAAELEAALARIATPDLPALPAAAAFRTGPRTIAAGERVPGPVAVADGNVDVYGTVEGDVIAFRGRIAVHAGGAITGNAIAIGGTVLMDGGQVAGQSLQLSAGPEDGAVQAPVTDSMKIGRRLALVAGWFAILLAISVGVMVLASENLTAVADAFERHYGSTLLAGVAGQLALAPVLVAVVVALILSVIGILLVPFAVVAYAIIAAGLVTLGFVASAVVVGRGWRAAPPGSDLAQRAATLRAVIVGLVILLFPWVLAAFLAPWPIAESLARGAAFATTWVAATAGLGATLISRAGIHRASSKQAQRAMASPSWQTPTPVSGVVAARRPAAAPVAGAR